MLRTRIYNVNTHPVLFSWLLEKLVRRHANKNLCILVCLLFQALAQLQAEIDHAAQLVNSSGEDKAIDVDEFMKATKQLETALGNVQSGVAAVLPAVLAAKQLISDLKVNARLQETHKHDVLLFRAAIPMLLFVFPPMSSRWFAGCRGEKQKHGASESAFGAGVR